MATSPLRSRGPIGGHIGYITPAFLGVPNRRVPKQKWLHLFFLAQTKMSWRSLLTSHQGSELSSATMIPQMTVVLDVTHSED